MIQIMKGGGMKDERILRIHERGDRYGIRHRGAGHSVPSIRLQGKWLRQAGFTPGERVVVQVEYGRLILEVTDDRCQ